MRCHSRPGGQTARQKPRVVGLGGARLDGERASGALPHSEEIGGLDRVYGVLSLAAGPRRRQGGA